MGVADWLSDPVALSAIIGESGLDAGDLLGRAGSPKTKALLRDRVSAAAQGVFGVPTMVIDGHLFRGFDDFPNLEAFLDGEPAIDKESIAAWSAVSPSASRKNLI